MDTFKVKRNTIQDLQNSMQDLESQFTSSSSKEADYLQQIQILEARCDAITRDIEDQGRKKGRALQFIKKSSKKLRTGQTTPGPTPEERDFFIRSLKETSTFSLKGLERFAEKYPDYREVITGQMELFGLQPPSRSVSRVSSRASSINGSVGSLHSRQNSSSDIQQYCFTNSSSSKLSSSPPDSLQREISTSSNGKLGSQKLSTTNINGKIS
jgi:hypothetical protein